MKISQNFAYIKITRTCLILKQGILWDLVLKTNFKENENHVSSYEVKSAIY